MEEKKTKYKQHQGNLKKIFFEIFEEVQKERIDRVLWVNLDVTEETFDADINHCSTNELTKALIELTEELGNENIMVECLKKMCNALNLDNTANATIFNIKKKKSQNFIGEINMTFDTFWEVLTE
jgi:hypothetical protein